MNESNANDKTAGQAMTRRDQLKDAAAGAVAAAVPASLARAAETGAKMTTTQMMNQAPTVACRKVPLNAPGAKAKVYFSRKIDAQTLIALYERINEGIYGKVAIKLHTGEKNGPNILPRDMVRAFQATVPDSSIVETNTLYHGDRYTTEQHLETLKVNGWTFCPVDIMDAEGTVNLPVRGGKHFKQVSMGGHIVNYDSMIVLTHFKGHAMGGFGGSMKNIAIGCADGRIGKAQVHAVDDVNKPWDQWPAKEYLMETMAESAKAVIDYFGKHIVFINVMRRMSVDCDCAGTSAAEPTIEDVAFWPQRTFWPSIRPVWIWSIRRRTTTISSSASSRAWACTSSRPCARSGWAASGTRSLRYRPGRAGRVPAWRRRRKNAREGRFFVVGGHPGAGAVASLIRRPRPSGSCGGA